MNNKDKSELIYQAISNFIPSNSETEIKETIKEVLDSFRVGRPKRETRNKEIVKDKESMSWTKLHDKWGLSVTRLVTIVNDAKGE